jgi:hypothetical protein
MVFVASLGGLGVIVFGLAFLIRKRYGGTLTGSAKRIGGLLLFIFQCSQWLVQVGKTARNVADIPDFLRRSFVWLDSLQFAGIAAHPSCTVAAPFASELSQIAVSVVALTIVSLIIIAAPLRTACKHRCKAIIDEPAAVDYGFNKRSKAAMQGWHRFKAFLTKPVIYRRLIVISISVIFSMVANTCFGLIRCDAPVNMRASAYLNYIGDGSAMRAAGIACGDGKSCMAGIGLSVAELRRVIPVSIVTHHPSYVCNEGPHRIARVLAIWTVVLLAGAYPLSAFLVVLLRMNILGKHVAPGAMGCPVRPPFVSGGLQRARVACSFSRRSRKLLTSKAVSGGTASQSRKAEVMDLDPRVASDPYLAPFTGGEYLPSMFYFIMVNYFVNLILSISAAYLNKAADYKARFAVNFVTLFVAILMVLSSMPYKQKDSYSFYVQLSLLGVAILVCITDVVGSSNSHQGVVTAVAFIAFIAMVIDGVALIVLFLQSLVQAAEREQEEVSTLYGLLPSPPGENAVTPSRHVRIFTRSPSMTNVSSGSVSFGAFADPSQPNMKLRDAPQSDNARSFAAPNRVSVGHDGGFVDNPMIGRTAVASLQLTTGSERAVLLPSAPRTLKQRNKVSSVVPALRPSHFLTGRSFVIRRQRSERKF